MIYGLENEEMPQELKKCPYTISPYIHRELIKSLFTRMMNCGSADDAYKAMMKVKENEENPELKAEFIKHLRDRESFDDIVSFFLHKHPVLREHVFTNKGLELMNWDSRVAEYVIENMTILEVPILCIHDSFIVAHEYEGLLIQFMEQAYIDLGIPHGKPTIKKKRSLLELNNEGQIKVIDKN